MASLLEQTGSLPLTPYLSLDNPTLTVRVQSVRSEMGRRLLILGHHYQQDEVVGLSDLRGDSFQLSRMAADDKDCRAIVFCGVHFMAETADILANRPQRLADAGASGFTLRSPTWLPAARWRTWPRLSRWKSAGSSSPRWSMSRRSCRSRTSIRSAGLKAFCGQRGGIVCTSANAAAVLKWSFARRRRVLFFPDQHLGRNTALAMGIPPDTMPVWDPHAEVLGGNSKEAIARSRVVLWKGYCSVHQMFLPAHVDQFRQRIPGVKILVHPECMMEVVGKADVIGSTGKIIRAVQEAPAGTKWAIGTELHLVQRLKHEHPEQEIHFLSPIICMCATMYRIDLPHLCWAAREPGRRHARERYPRCG